MNKPEMDIVVKWADWRHYLAQNFSTDELDWVLWKHSSYFGKMETIPDWMKVTEVVLRWSVKTKTCNILCVPN